MPEKIIIHIDGGSRGNPGPAAAGFTLADSAGTQLVGKGFFLGRATNNIAEYTSFLKALEAAKQAGAEQLTVYSDSELVVRQITGKYKVKKANLKTLYQQVGQLLSSLEGFTITHIPRMQNTEADKLANRALDTIK